MCRYKIVLHRDKKYLHRKGGITTENISEQAMRKYLNERSGKFSTDDFAAHILRNYSIEQCAELGANMIEQAYNVLRRNLHDYE